MLHPDDEQIVQRERSIPGMRALLDNDVFTKMFQASFQALGVRAAICKYLRYKPGTSCIAAFTLNTEFGDIWAHAIAYRADATDKILKAKQSVLRCPDLRAVLIEQAVVMTLFPLDDDLQSLGLLDFSVEQKIFLRKLAPHVEELHSAPITTLRYKPQRRYVGRIDVNDAPQAILKLHSLTEYQQARRAAKSLQSISGTSTAKVIGHSDRHRAILMKWVAGTSLSELINNGTASLYGIMKDLGGFLKELHSHPGIKLPTINVNKQQRSLTILPHELMALCPELANNSQSAVDQACQMHAKLSRPITSLHGDLSCDQVVVGDGVSLIDFDNAVLGHAEQDLGNLLAHLEKSSLNRYLDVDAVEAIFETLLQEYEMHGGQVNKNAIHLHAAISLLRLVQEPFRVRQRNWQACSEMLLNRAQKHLGLASHHIHREITRANSQHASRTGDILALHRDSSLTNSHPAVDLHEARKYVLPLLKKELQDESLQVRSLRLVRHKPGKRCLIEYSCESDLRNCVYRVLGKAYSKPKHIQNHSFQTALSRAGLNDRSSAEVFVPRPLGVLDQWQMFFQEHVCGEDGWRAISNNPVVSSNQILTAIQNLQESQILTVRKHTVADEIEHIQKCLPLVMLNYPEIRHRIKLLIDRCELLGHTVPEAVLVPTHRDFYPDQIIFTTRGLCLIDFDLFCLSDPGLDLGNFYGHLIERSLRDPAFSPKASECHNQFVAHYINTDRESEWKTVEAFATLTLARHVYLSTLFVDRCRFTATILDECERRLDAQLAGNYWTSSCQAKLA